MFLYLEGDTSLFQYHAKHNVKSLGLGCRLVIVTAVNCKLWIVGILHISTCEFCIFFYIYTVVHKLLVQFIHCPELTGEVNHRTSLALLVHHKERRNTCSLGNECVIGTESRSDMHDTCTVLGSHIVTRDDTERICRSVYDIVAILGNRFYPWEQLSIVHAYKIGTLVLTHNAIRNNLVTCIVLLHREFGTGRVEVSRQQSLCKHNCYGLTSVAIVCLHCNVVNLWTNAERGVRRQCPWGCCPCNEVWCTPLCHLGFGIEHTELCNSCSILYIAVAAGLIKLV